MVTIQISDPHQRGKAVVELGWRGQVTGLPEGILVVAEPALELLQRLKIHFQELHREGPLLLRDE